MAGNPHRWRAAIPQLENRNATAGCLLAVLFFVPFLAETYHINFAVLGLLVLVYVGLIVPLGTGIISRKYVIRRLRKAVSLILDESKWNYYLTQLTYLASWLHFIYFQFEGVHIFMMQVTFNMAAEKVLCPDQRLSCLYILLFYSLIAHLQRTLQANLWVDLLNVTSPKEFIVLARAFVIARLGKGLILSAAVLIFTIQFNHLEPSGSFVWLTLLFFLLTQYQNNPTVKKYMIDWLSYLELHCLDGMEELWVPVLTNSLTVGLSVILCFKLFFMTDHYVTLVLLGYINVFVPTVYSIGDAVRSLMKELAVISKFPLATWMNPQIRGGNRCAVCLEKMRVLSARCTPCSHVFHGSCLRKCLHNSPRCPLCNTKIR